MTASVATIAFRVILIFFSFFFMKVYASFGAHSLKRRGKKNPCRKVAAGVCCLLRGLRYELFRTQAPCVADFCDVAKRPFLSSLTRSLTYVSPLPIVFASSLPDILWIPISDLMALLTCRPNGLTSIFLLPTSIIIARNCADMRADELKCACFNLTVRAIARIMWTVKEET